MSIEHEMDWVKNSRKIKDLDVEICFQLQDNFYVGDPNSHEQLQDEKYREPIELPPFERVVESMARTSESIENIDELVSYYKTIIEKAEALNKSFNEIRQYFWLRLWFWNTEEDIHISFPWYDSLSEMQQFTTWLKADPEKEAYIDMDQGWQIEAIRSGEYLYIRQTDPDYDEEHASISIPFEIFTKAISEVEVRAIEIILSLSSSVGADVWSKYLQDAKFGTPEWQPSKKINRTKKSDGFFSRLFGR